MSDDIPFCGNGLLLWWLIHHRLGGPRDPGDPVDRVSRVLDNIDLVLATGVLVSTATLYPDKAFSLRWGAMLWVPAVRLVGNLIANNVTMTSQTLKKK